MPALPVLITAVFVYLNYIYRRDTAVLCPYGVVYLPENRWKSELSNLDDVQLIKTA
ncbi:hypothetical protein Cylst_2021 [Cylindrospermum stagnale PCC 7417]|uniref:Uncharacterized protein n=1 Tax=Cylindrospermum stagnale PCC 7417 TaxID=56107 RepID=K9WV50_9NOST|nr:hypothetical protein Cylst_2021 [Cylindrospermum stagnale PCC 7417]